MNVVLDWRGLGINARMCIPSSSEVSLVKIRFIDHVTDPRSNKYEVDNGPIDAPSVEDHVRSQGLESLGNLVPPISGMDAPDPSVPGSGVHMWSLDQRLDR